MRLFPSIDCEANALRQLRSWRGALCAIGLFAGAHGIAWGQQARGDRRPESGPDRALFGGASRDTSRGQSLDLSVSILGGYDDNITAADAGTSGGLADPRYARNGSLANAYTNLSFRKTKNENYFVASGRAGFRYYPSFMEMNAGDYGAHAGFAVRLSRRAFVTAAQDVGYRPFYSLNVTSAIPTSGAVAVPPAADYSYLQRPSVSYGTNGGVTYDLTRRLHAEGGYSLSGLQFTQTGDMGGMRQQSGRVGLSRSLSRRTTLGAQYLYDAGDNSTFGPSSTFTSQNIQLNLAYRRPLRAGRVLSVRVSPGYGRQHVNEASLGPRRERRITAAGAAALSLGRNWSLASDYRRGLRYLPGVRDPVFSDDVQARVTGLLSRRIDLSLSVLYSRGEGTVASSTGFNTLGGAGQLRWALNRLTAITGSYAFYRYEFAEGMPVPAGLPPDLSRHAVRIGVELWLPLYR